MKPPSPGAVAGVCTVLHGDSREVLKSLPDGHFAAAVMDPPYELGFMRKDWDRSGIANEVALWREVWRVLKPGAHLLAFGGTRTQHRMVCAIEDAGFEIRDQMQWLYGSGFPKSLDVGKAIDKAAGAAEARAWSGWGTALKPACEPICVARKPLAEGTVAANVLTYGTGAINVDACRVEAPDAPEAPEVSTLTAPRFSGRLNGGLISAPTSASSSGRWPANVMHDGSVEVLAAFAEFGERPGMKGKHTGREIVKPGYNGGLGAGRDYCGIGDTGTAARFFYCAKASGEEREGNGHATVKPLALIRYLVRLVTPPGGEVLDCFAGSGTLGVAALGEGFSSTLIEREAQYVAIIQSRLARVQPGLGL